MNWTEIAKAGYEEFRRSEKAQTDKWPAQWKDLGTGAQATWISATRAICDVFARAATA